MVREGAAKQQEEQEEEEKDDEGEREEDVAVSAPPFRETDEPSFTPTSHHQTLVAVPRPYVVGAGLVNSPSSVLVKGGGH